MRIVSRLLKFLYGFAEFASLKIKRAQFKPDHQIRRIFLNAFLAFGQLIIQFLRLDFCRLLVAIRREWIELLQLMIEAAHNRLGHRAFKRGAE